MKHDIRHYLTFADCGRDEVEALLAAARAIKAEVRRGEYRSRLPNRSLLMYFEKASTRTRVSFATAMTQAGGSAAEFPQATSQLGRGETIADTARVLSAYCDVLMLRVNAHATVEEFAVHASCPVINGLSDVEHPCQVLADVLTFQELRGSLRGARVAWVGDCNNVLQSWVSAAQLLGCELAVACPLPYMRDYPNNSQVQFYDTPQEAAKGADLLMTDLWVSMGDEDKDERYRAFADYQVTESLLAAANKDVVFMHCLPAHRGEEVQGAVIDGAHSVVWQQAENRLHAQKALILHLLGVAV